MRVQVEHGVTREVDVTGDERRRQLERRERVPDGLMERQRVWVVYERFKEDLEGFGCGVVR